jgi:hypothetical protein
MVNSFVNHLLFLNCHYLGYPAIYPHLHQRPWRMLLYVSVAQAPFNRAEDFSGKSLDEGIAVLRSNLYMGVSDYGA